MSQPPEQPAWGTPDQPAQPAQPAQPPAYPYAGGPEPYPAQPYPQQPYPAQPNQAQPYGWSAFKDVSALGTAMIVISSLIALGDVLAAATSFAAADAYRAAAPGDDVFTAHDGVGVISLLQLPNWIIASIWLTNARRNAVQIAPQEVRRHAAWCWLGWIVPIVSLWFPRQMVNDVWRLTASALPAGHPAHRDARTHPPTGLWWALWIVYLVLGNIVGRAAFDGADGISPPLEIALAVVSIAALVCWIRVVLGVSRVQRTLAAGPVAPAAGPYPYAA